MLAFFSDEAQRRAYNRTYESRATSHESITELIDENEIFMAGYLVKE